MSRTLISAWLSSGAAPSPADGSTFDGGEGLLGVAEWQMSPTPEFDFGIENSPIAWRKWHPFQA